MLKRRNKSQLAAAFWIALLLSVAISAVFSGSRSPEDHDAEACSTKNCATEAKQESSQPTADDRIADYTWWLTVMTGILAGVTAILAVVSFFQLHFLNRSDQTARISAEAAKTSADSFKAKERAYLIPRHVSGGLHVVSDSKRYADAWNGYMNIGVTAARVYETRLKVQICKNAPWPLDLRDAAVEIHHGYKIAQSNATIDGPQSAKLNLTLDQHQSLERGEITLFAIGSVTYKTVFDSLWTRVFTFKFKVDLREYVPTLGDKLNFEVEGYYTAENDSSVRVSSTLVGDPHFDAIHVESKKDDHQACT